MRVSNNITICRVANGWTVHMPAKYEVDSTADEMAKGVQQGLEGIQPILQSFIEKMHKDPLLEKLQETEDEKINQQLEEWAESQLKKEETPVIGQDEGLYVCRTFDEVLELLAVHFLSIDGQ